MKQTIFLVALIVSALQTFTLFAQQPMTLTVTMATMQGVTGSSIPVQAVRSSTGGVQISPMYVRTEAIAANAAFERIPRENHIERAQALFALLRLTEYETITKQCDTTVLKTTPLQLAKQWRKIEPSLGEFKKINNTSADQFATGELVSMEADFERMLLDVKFSFTEQHLINGISFAPAGPKYRTPSYSKPDSTEERSITVTTDKYALPGILTLPKFLPSGAKIPVVVLLHGAGAEDKDRSSGPLKPNKDLALGLAAEGIASIRYEKRTKLYALKGNEAETFTVKEEVIDDAVAALELVRTLSATTPIDAGKIVIIAPNLAATLVPRINNRDAEKNSFARRITGAVLVAANHRTWLETVRSRFNKAFMLDYNINTDERRVLNTLDKEIALVNSKDLSPKTPIDKLPFNLPGSYWLDLKKYNHVQALTNATFPMLFLHGEQDRYMGIEEFMQWKEKLAKKQNVAFISYPSLVNLLMPKPPESQKQEQPENVPVNVIRDIADWIKKR